jgi:DNA-binding Lrp family transcriptional regulator
MTKHEEILKYIRDLQVGTKVSVRSIASDLNVSEGTAYRAIKEAENWGLVSAIPRVGTIRIEKVEKKKFVFTYELKMITYICTVSILYGLLFEKIGYVLATTFFMGALLFAFNGVKKWRVNIIVALSFSISIYYSFSNILSVPLPKMIFLNI